MNPSPSLGLSVEILEGASSLGFVQVSRLAGCFFMEPLHRRWKGNRAVRPGPWPQPFRCAWRRTGAGEAYVFWGGGVLFLTGYGID